MKVDGGIAAYIAGNLNITYPSIVALTSLREHNPSIDLFLFLSDADKINTEQISICKKYDICVIDPVGIDKNYIKGMKGFGEWPVEIFYNYIVPLELYRKGYKYAIKVDYDILCINPLEWDEIIPSDEEIIAMAAKGFVRNYIDDANLRKFNYENGLKILEGTKTCNAGFLVILLEKYVKLDIPYIYRTLYLSAINNEIRIHGEFIEQFLLGLIQSVIKKKFRYIPKTKYNCTICYTRLENDICILHYNTKYKPWIHYHSFDKLEGEIFKDSMDVLKQLVCSNIWIEYFQKIIPSNSSFVCPDKYSALDIARFYQDFKCYQYKEKYKNALYWKRIMSTILPEMHSSLYIDYDFDLTYFRFYIKGFPKNIHYELLRSGGEILFCIHCEIKDEKLRDGYKNIFESLAREFGLNSSANIFNIRKRIDQKNISKEFLMLVEKTIKYFIGSSILRNGKHSLPTPHIDKPFDVGILGRYTNQNWGGCLTAMTTYATIADMGFKAKILKLKGHNDDENVIYNRLCDFTKAVVNSPSPPTDWNKYFSNFLLCSDWTLHKNWFLPLDIKMFSWVKDDVNKITMASSFGSITGGYAEKDYPMLFSYLKRFQHLSIREDYGVELCKKVGVDYAVVMPDPVFAQDADYYIKIADLYPHERIEGKFAAIYLLDMEEDKIRIAVNIAEKIGIEPLFLVAEKDARKIDKLDTHKYIYIKDFSQSLSAWIFYLYHGEAVITNSFHGACLGFIFGKNVLSIYRGGGFASRLIALLKRFGLEKKFISSIKDVETALDVPIDYKKVSTKIHSMNEEIRTFLWKSIMEGKRKGNRINSLPKPDCTGCMSCVNICPKKCITVEADSETGFLYPIIDESSCVNCGMCKTACPVLSRQELPEQVNRVYCGHSKDEEIRYQSSSGGFFTELAKGVFAQGNAVVFGAAYETPYIVAHIGVTEEKNLPQIRQSKYVQSEIRDTYLQIEQHLREGNNVMFCGTPCQCAAVRSFIKLKKVPDENLYLVDFICHSVHSPKAYAAYLSELEKSNGARIKSVWFRNKEDSWARFSMRIDFEGKETYYIKNHNEDVFYKGFLKHLYARPSCTNCNFRGENRHSDITLADAWGISMACDKNHGISTAIVHTEKGQKLFDAISDQVYTEEKSMDAVSKCNRHLMSSTALSGNSKYFYQRLAQGIPFSKIIEEVDKNNLAGKDASEKKSVAKVQTNGAVVRAHATAQIITKPGASLVLNAGKVPGAASDCLIELDEGAKIIVEGNFRIYHSCRIRVHKNAVLTLGNGYMNTNTIVVCANSITIGDAIIAPNCYIVDSDYHRIMEKGKVINPPAPVKFEGHVWLGQNVTVLKGVTIGKGSVIGAKSLVTKNVPAKSLAAGVPAKIIRSDIEWR